MTKEKYMEFRNSSDFDTWKQCYQSLSAFYSDTPPTAIDDFVQLFIISIYTSWLSGLNGELGFQKEILAKLKNYINLFETKHPIGDSPKKETIKAYAILAGINGYHKKSTTLLKENELLNANQNFLVELAGIITPNKPRDRALFLTDYWKTPEGNIFFPTFYLYCEALFQLGEFSKIRDLIKNNISDKNIEFVRELLGKIYEKEGNWENAYQQYLGSNWIQHYFRALICKNISEGFTNLNQTISAMDNKKISIALQAVESEISQLELARSQAFINACRMNGFDNWLMNFEIGKISFRRRQYSKAEYYFRKVLEEAPKDVQFNLHALRFSNLTWLHKNHFMLNLNPEITECVMEAIVCEVDEDLKTNIRTWQGKKELIQPVLNTNDLFEKARAFSIMGDEDETLKYRRQGVLYQFSHREMMELSAFFHSINFYQTSIRLMEIALKESEDHFFNTWELGEKWIAIHTDTEANLIEPNRGQSEILSRIANKLEVLSKFNFQDLIRAYDFFLKYKRNDIARALILKAEKFAESAEELLTIASLRRSTRNFNKSVGDNFGLDCLIRAERISQDRLERLLIAREYFYFYRQKKRTERILLDELENGELTNFKPIELIIFLESAKVFGEVQYLELLHKSAEILVEDIRKGLHKYSAVEQIKRFLNKFKEELTKETIIILDEILDEKRTKQSSEKSNLEETIEIVHDWKSTNKKINTAKDSGNEYKALEEAISQLKNKSIDYKFVFWKYLINEIIKEKEKIQNFRPNVDPDQIPIIKSMEVMEDGRSQEISTLYKSFLRTTDLNLHEVGKKRINEFYKAEKTLETNWNKAFKKGCEVFEVRKTTMVSYALKLLYSMEKDISSNQYWPSFLNIKETILQDIKNQKTLFLDS